MNSYISNTPKGAFIACALLVLLLPPGAVGASTRLITLVTTGTEEPVVAVDPRDPQTILVATNFNLSLKRNGRYSAAFYTSHDGGRSFHGGSVPLQGAFDAGADPSIGIGSDGTAFYSFLTATPTYCGGAPGTSAVMVAISRNGGNSFGYPVKVDVSAFDDKPYMAIRNPHHGPTQIFVAWTRFVHGSEIWFSRSLDGGHHYSRPVLIYRSSASNMGALPVVAPHNRLYVFWSSITRERLSAPGQARILMSASRDDGATFGSATGVGPSFASLPQMLRPGLLRVLTVPSAVATGQGRLYVAWPAVSRVLPGGAVRDNILLTSSADGGATWSPPRAVNDATRGDRFMPSLSTLGDGSVGVAFYDRRHGFLDVYAARASADGAFRVSRNIRVNRARSRVADLYLPTQKETQCFSPGRFFGDYIGTARAGKGGMYVTWTDTGRHIYAEEDVWLTRVVLQTLRFRA